MERIWILILAGGLAASCADEAGKSVGAAWHVPEDAEEHAPERAAGQQAAGEFLEKIALVEDEGCEVASIIGAADLEHDVVGPPRITERFGADGCVDERWQQAWDGDLLTRERYDVFDVSLYYYAYVDPFSYTHVWERDEEGRAVRETQTPDDGEPLLVARTFDDAGRLIETTQRNGLWMVEGTVHAETWTFHPSNPEEYETHTVEVGDYYSRDRRVFDTDGQIVEQYYAPSREQEHLIRRVERNGEGHSIREETWDRSTGNPEAITTIERRADGTMARKVRHSLRMGWLDVWEYDEAEREVLHTQDEDRDGQIEYRAVHRYDEAGNLVLESREYDFANPQTTYSQVEYTFDEQNRMTERLAAQAWMRGQQQRLRLEYDADGPGYLSTLETLESTVELVRVERV